MAVTAVVDFGTSHTVVVVSTSAGTPTLVSVDGEPWCPSAVFWGAGGRPSVGADAMRLGRAEPARLEPRPKARLGEPEVLLGDTVVPTTALVRALLARVVEEAARVAGGPVQHLTLTHPADWGASRLGVLLTAAQGLAPRLSTVAEPVAAAAWFARRHELPVGAHLAVLDVGGGTCDAAVVTRQPTGLTVAGCAGLPDLGGADLDQRIVTYLRAHHPELDRYLAATEENVTAPEMVALARFRGDVRDAKEVLSRYPHADVVLPDRLGEVILTRDEFEGLVRADLRRAVELLDDTVRDRGLTPADLTAVHLVGGSARVPLLAQLLQEWSQAPVRLNDQPETVVAFGGHAVAAGPNRPAPEPAAPAERGPLGVASPRPSRRTAPLVVGLAAAVVALLVPAAVDGVNLTAGAATAAGPPRASLPDPPPGDPVAMPGNAVAELPVVAEGQPVTLSTGSDDTMWQLDDFADDAETDRAMAELGNVDNDQYRWILVRTTLSPVGKAAYLDLSTNVYLVDDRGLMIGQTPARLPNDCHPEDRERLVPPGQTAGQCVAFQVSVNTPVTDVALSVLSPVNPASSDSAHIGVGARVPVRGQRVSGQAQPITDRATPLGAWQDVRFDDGAAQIAVVDLVEDVSAFYPTSSPRGLPGSRAVLVRAVVDTDQETAAYFLTPRLFVTDDRGTAIRSANAGPGTHGCLDALERESFRGRATLCHLFVVPTGTPIAAVGISAEQPYVWRVR